MYVVWCLLLAFQGVLCVDFSWLFKSFGSLSEKGNVGTDAGLKMVVVFLCLFWLTVTIIYTRHSNSIIVKSNSGSSNYSPHPRKKLPEFIFTCTKCTCVISVHIEEIVHSSINKYMMYMKFLGKKSIPTALHDNINIRCCLCTITHWTFFSFRTTFMVFYAW